MRSKRGLPSAIIAVTLLSFLAGEAQAAGFHLSEKSTRAAGRAFSGVSAATDDAGIIAYNPAGMTELGGPSGGIGGFYVQPRAKLDDDGSSMTVGPVGPLPVTGDSQGQGFHAQYSGYVYAAAPVKDELSLGLSVTVPFGLKARYDPDFFGRYDSIKSSLIVVEIAPSWALRISDQVSIGGSLNIQRVNATLTNALPNPLDPNGPNPASDGLLTIKGNDWSVGYLFGIHLRPTEQLEMGLTYRRSPTHKLEGTSTTDFAGMAATEGASAKLHLPDVMTLGARFKATDRLSLLGEVSHFGWSEFDELRIEFEQSPAAVTTENFRDTWALSVGAEYAVSEALTVRTGLLYDQTPARDAYRSTRIPDTDRLWAGLGASYGFGGNWSVDISYMHMFTNTEPVTRDNEFAALATSVRTQAITHTSSNVLGLGLQARF